MHASSPLALRFTGGDTAGARRVKINCVVYLMIIEGKNDFIENHAQFYHYITGIEQGIKVSLTFPDCRLLVSCWPLGGPSLLMVLLIHSSTGFLKDSHHRNTRMMSYNYNRHSRTTHIEPSWNVKSSGPWEASLPTKLVEVMEFQLSYFKS